MLHANSKEANTILKRLAQIKGKAKNIIDKVAKKHKNLPTWPKLAPAGSQPVMVQFRLSIKTKG
jgi:hypothetical protein